jgi:DNA repair exonuclease SbcCD ATPase subunit
MLLILENFGCWDYKELDIPDIGCMLISAPTGKGKSTIFRAVVFALYGTGNKLIKFGKKKCKVELTFHGMRIVRRKGPESLLVTDLDTNKVMEKDEAQQFIQSRIKTDSFFMGQGNKHFLSKTAREKLEVLENISTKHNAYNMETIKDALKVRVKKLEREVVNLETQNKVASELLKMYIPPANPVLEKPVLPSYEVVFYRREIRQCTEMLETDEREYYKLQSKNQRIREITTLLNDLPSKAKLISDRNLYTAFTEYSRKHGELMEKEQSLYQELEFINKQYVEAYDTYTALPSPKAVKKSLTDLEECKKKHAYKLQLEREMEELLGVMGEVGIDTMRQQLTDDREEMTRLKVLIDNLKTVYRCPTCKATLELKGRELVLRDKEVDDTQSVAELEASVEELRNNIYIGEKKLTQRIRHEDRLQYVKNELSPLTDIQEPNLQELNHLYKVRDQHTTLTSQIQALEQQQTRLQTKYDQTVEEIERLQPQTLTFPIDINLVQTQLTQTQLLEDELAKLPVGGEEDPVELEILRDKINLLESQLEQLNDWNWTVQFNTQTETTNKLKTTQQELLSIDIFTNLISEAEAQSLNAVIETINITTEKYLEAFFPDEPLTANIRAFKNKTKPEINVELTYKGMDVDMSTLSSGERDRLYLAYTMAFSELEQSPILLLDECVSSLDGNTANIIFDYIKENSKSSLCLIIAHQIVTGIFDHVITF